MQSGEIEIRVFHIPGGEAASLLAYDHLVALLEAHEDLLLTVYRGRKSLDGTWSLVLIGETTALIRYHEQIQRLLSDVQAQPMMVPPEQLAPLVKRFLLRRAEMQRTKQTFFEQHHPLSKKQYSTQKDIRTSKKRKKRKK